MKVRIRVASNQVSYTCRLVSHVSGNSAQAVASRVRAGGGYRL